MTAFTLIAHPFVSPQATVARQTYQGEIIIYHIWWLSLFTL